MLDEFCISTSSEESTLHVFPCEEPTHSDFCLWTMAINRLCSGTTSLLYSLGQHVQIPHLPCTWFTTESTNAVYRARDEEPSPSYNIYHLQERGAGTRHGGKYDWEETISRLHPGTHYASITMSSLSCVVMHSKALFPSPPTPPTSFLETLESFGNPSLWENLHVDGNGEWI
jgi:hypothetical protein